MNTDIFSSKTLFELIDYLFWFQMKMPILKDLKLEDIIYEKELLIIIMSSLLEHFYDLAIDSNIQQYEEI